jgi:hypothetical protein
MAVGKAPPTRGDQQHFHLAVRRPRGPYLHDIVGKLAGCAFFCNFTEFLEASPRRQGHWPRAASERYPSDGYRRDPDRWCRRCIRSTDADVKVLNTHSGA